MTTPLTLYDKIWNEHIVRTQEDGTNLIWIDRHLIHEVTTPQAFAGLRAAGRRVRRPDLTLAVPDHNVPTKDRHLPNPDEASALQLLTLEENCRDHGIERISMDSIEQGIVHVVGPEQAFTLPGLTLVCGDSHTPTHGALGALAFGIGTSEVEHVFATQTLLLRRSKTMRITVEGKLGFGVTAKDLALAVIRQIGSGGGTGHVIEFDGPVVRALSIEARMTLCNMAIEAGARAGLIAPDEKTFAYLKGRPRAPDGALWGQAVDHWRTLASDTDAVFDRTVAINASSINPLVTWGTNPEEVISVMGKVPSPSAFADAEKREEATAALNYMGLTAGMPIASVPIQHVFIGSCTNGRIEDLRDAARVVEGRHVAPGIKQALVVPGSGLVRMQAEAEGLDRVFLDAGFEWRQPGCSMCLAMNPDRIPTGERCASTSNRNFVGRQGPGSRTHLMSPAMAAAAAVVGHITDVRELIS